MTMAARYDDPKVTAAVQAVLDENPLDLHPSKVGALPDLWTPQSWARPELLSEDKKRLFMEFERGLVLYRHRDWD